MSTPVTTNGPGAAAVLSASLGSFVLALLALAGDKSPAIKALLNIYIYKPTGPLSGVTTFAIVVWLLTWAIFEWRWHTKTVALGRIGIVALALLAAAFLLTFPPFADLL